MLYTATNFQEYYCLVWSAVGTVCYRGINITKKKEHCSSNVLSIFKDFFFWGAEGLFEAGHQINKLRITYGIVDILYI